MMIPSSASDPMAGERYCFGNSDIGPVGNICYLDVYILPYQLAEKKCIHPTALTNMYLAYILMRPHQVVALLKTRRILAFVEME